MSSLSFDAQVIGNKYEVYVEYLKNDFKEG